ncbi:YkgJ family cysteine cluster protein [Parasedimentitalea maritima]|uniref:YkgJ family cysteine cluster protein n=1 Tax=Parasedimentitalea maritima TaxID=2578117 RepID=A0ABY2V5F0_9RHOB|nr:YkgJ family cysteine cluster protein [Zongyanglinia marina]
MSFTVRFILSDGLCVSCSLCCNGTLFSRLAISQQEADRLEGDIEVFTRNEKLRMRLPCPQLGNDGACGCYLQRPKTCRTYRCQLLKRNERGAIPNADALAIVKDLHAMQDKAKSAAIDATPGPERRKGNTNAAQAMRALKTARSKHPEEIDKYLFQNAEFHFETFVRYVRLHLQPNFRKEK